MARIPRRFAVAWADNIRPDGTVRPLGDPSGTQLAVNLLLNNWNTMQTPSRSVPLAGTSNFRDLGGYAGHGGRSVRWRKLFRSDHLGALTPDDIQTLSGLGLTRVCDFRAPLERTEHVCAMPGVNVHSLPIDPAIVQGMKQLMLAGCRITAHDTVQLMEQTYRAFVLDNSERFAELFAHLLESDAPLVFHCTAGKDRTGFAAALVLSALGVSRPQIMHDYLLTNDLFRMPASSAGAAPQEVLEVLWRVQEPFLNAAFKVVEADHGGIDAYLAKALRVGPQERAQLARLYLQP